MIQSYHCTEPVLTVLYHYHRIEYTTIVRYHLTIHWYWYTIDWDLQWYVRIIASLLHIQNSVNVNFSKNGGTTACSVCKALYFLVNFSHVLLEKIGAFHVLPLQSSGMERETPQNHGWCWGSIHHNLLGGWATPPNIHGKIKQKWLFQTTKQTIHPTLVMKHDEGILQLQRTTLSTISLRRRVQAWERDSHVLSTSPMDEQISHIVREQHFPHSEIVGWFNIGSWPVQKITSKLSNKNDISEALHWFWCILDHRHAMERAFFQGAFFLHDGQLPKFEPHVAIFAECGDFFGGKEIREQNI